MNDKELKKIEKHFAKAKRIHCLNLKRDLDITNIPRLQYNPDDDSVTGPARIVCYWRQGKFAEIVK